MKKALKIIAVIAAVAAAIAGIYVLVTKLIEKRKLDETVEENYASYIDDDFTSETTEEE